MAERKGDTKNTLLDELESIKGLLVEDGTLDDDDIPILREVIESIEPADPERPRQPSLFTRDAFTQDSSAQANQNDSLAARQRPRPPQPTRAEGENPFLPAHIRARLQGNQPPPLLSENELSASEHRQRFGQSQFSRSSQTHSNIAETQPTYGARLEEVTRSDLIEAVISELRPELETRLRARLEPLSQDVLLRLLTAGDNEEEKKSNES